MKVPTRRAAVFTVFFVNLITSNGGGGEMDCARNWVGSPTTHLTKALEIGPGIASPLSCRMRNGRRSFSLSLSLSLALIRLQYDCI